MASTLPESRAAIVRRLRSLRALIGSWALSVPRLQGAARQAPAPSARLGQELGEIAMALEVLGQPALAILARATSAALGRLQQAPALIHTDVSAALDRAVSALLLATEVGLPPGAAVSLFPVYRSVQTLAGVGRVHPADLWWPQSGLSDDPRAVLEPEVTAIDGALLAELESASLDLMRLPQASVHLRLHGLCARVAGRQAPSQAQTWLFAQAVFEALAGGLLAFDPYVKRLVPRLLALARGKAEAASDGPRLRRDLMFHCAQAAGAVAGPLPPVLSRVCRVHGIEPLHDRWPAPARQPLVLKGSAGAPPVAQGTPGLSLRATAPVREAFDSAQEPSLAIAPALPLVEAIPSLPAAAELELLGAGAATQTDDEPDATSADSGRGRIPEPDPTSAQALADAHDAATFRVPTLAAQTLEFVLPRTAPAGASDDAARQAAGGVAGLGLPDLEILVGEVESIDGAVREGTSVVDRLRILACDDEGVAGGIEALDCLKRLDAAFGQIDVATRRMRSIAAPATLPALIEPVDILWIPTGIDQR